MKRLAKTLIALVVLALFGVFCVGGVILYISMDLPQINSLKDYNPPMNSKILSKDGEVLLDIGLETRDVVEFDQIPKRVVSAFLAAEDDNFYNHQGVDYMGILRAFMVNLKEGRLVQGGSTITQQVAKSFLLTKERTISRKIKDLLLARKIEQKLSKEEILYLYLNQVYLGGGYYGVKAAFRGYFDKDLEEATPAESALVAGLLVAPGRYSPYVKPKYAKIRQTYVLKRMYETGKISKEEYESALQENIKMRIRKRSEGKAGYFTDWIRQEVMKTVGVDEFLSNGYTVVTTLDWSLQQIAEKSVKEKVKDLDKRQGYKGALKTFASEEESREFLLDQRKKIFKAESTFFTFTTEGKNRFEYQEEEEDLENVGSYFEEEKEKLNERFKSLVLIGNHSSEKMLNFLEIGKSYQGIVIDVDDLKRTITVNIGGARVIIPESGFSWAHERKFSEEPHWFAPVKQPSKVAKKGQLILVRIDERSVPSDQLISSDFYKKYSDTELKHILGKQKFVKGFLDQEPDAEGALISVQARTGNILSLVGGIDFQKSQFNRAIQSSRQPGSAFKPFIYAAGLENGFNPSSILMDSPQALGGANDSLSWKPRNYDGDFKGPMTFRNALEVSRNIPTVKLLQEIGVNKMIDYLDRIHLSAQIPKDLSLSLGSFGVSLAELAKAYAIFPNGGKAIRLHHIVSIKDRNGKEYVAPPADPNWPEVPEKVETPPTPAVMATEEGGESEPLPVLPPVNPFLENLNQFQVYDKRLAYIMTNLLNGVTLHGTAGAAGRLNPHLGGKTGTTNNFVDSLFVGFSSDVVVGAWAGFDDNRPLGYGETGARTALPMFIDYMSAVIDRYGAEEFKVPDGITHLMINKKTGRPLPPGSGEGFLESYVEGFDPNSENEKSDQSTQDLDAKPRSLDDGDYWENQ